MYLRHEIRRGRSSPRMRHAARNVVRNTVRRGLAPCERNASCGFIAAERNAEFKILRGMFRREARRVSCARRGFARKDAFAARDLLSNSARQICVSQILSLSFGHFNLSRALEFAERDL